MESLLLDHQANIRSYKRRFKSATIYLIVLKIPAFSLLAFNATGTNILFSQPTGPIQTLYATCFDELSLISIGLHQK